MPILARETGGHHGRRHPSRGRGVTHEPNGQRSPWRGRRLRETLDADLYEGSIVHPQTPQGRRAFESPDWDDPAAQPASRAPERDKSAARAMLASFLALVVIVALILLL